MVYSEWVACNDRLGVCGDKVGVCSDDKGTIKVGVCSGRVAISDIVIYSDNVEGMQ